jgi:imidazolonepropionase
MFEDDSRNVQYVALHPPSMTSILLKNASQLVTISGENFAPRIGEGMSELGVVENGSVWINHGQITAVGASDRAEHDVETIIDCSGKTVLPGLVDPHTHVVFAGSREAELGMKLRGVSYMEILKSGGGILSTVKATREASKEELISQTKRRLDTMLAHGTTTAEAKSGYGLEKATEFKMLEVIKELDADHPIDLVPTFLGAHAVPKDYAGRSGKFIEELIGMFPLIRERELALFCDVFCEDGAFSLAESRLLLENAKAQGFALKIHADEIDNLGASTLAAELGALSAEHLVLTSEDDMRAMAGASVIGILLPGTPYSLMDDKYANARKMIELGMPIALATDLNPNCWTESMQFIMSLACYKMGMTPEEAIVAATMNAAFAVGRQEQVGSIEVGKQADIIILDVPNYNHIPYRFGVNHVERVIKRGEIVVGST